MKTAAQIMNDLVSDTMEKIVPFNKINPSKLIEAKSHRREIVKSISKYLISSTQIKYIQYWDEYIPEDIPKFISDITFFLMANEEKYREESLEYQII